MMQYSIESIARKCVKGYEFLCSQEKIKNKCLIKD